MKFFGWVRDYDWLVVVVATLGATTAMLHQLCPQLTRAIGSLSQEQ